MNGKATCAILKQIRRDIAQKNDIALTIAECTYQGSCSGTCPRCEAEVRLLEKALAEKKKRGIRTAVAGISAGLLAAGLISCTPVGAEGGPQDPDTQITETGENSTVEAPVIDGELVPPGSTDDGGDEERGEQGTVVPYIEEDGEAFQLMGEPMVTDYCAEDDGEGEGVPPTDDPIATDPLPDDWEEVEFAGIMPAPDYTEEQP